MVVKTLTVTEDAYRRLRAQKGEAESFSELIVRLTSRRPLTSFAGSLTDSEAAALGRRITADRRARAKLDRARASRH